MEQFVTMLGGGSSGKNGDTAAADAASASVLASKVEAQVEIAQLDASTGGGGARMRRGMGALRASSQRQASRVASSTGLVVARYTFKLGIRKCVWG